ncbi:hypothetical protein B0H12DRAFT_1012467 [Mycena haematopus]|nr:hypothetical protein B0H12DRAFT_1012467 [Mycena haematopus]
MRSFAASIIAAVVFATLTVKGDFVAFSGNDCDGDQGANVACDGSCHSFDGRHSFELFVTGSHCVTMFEDDGCVGETFQFGPETQGNCINVNTGTPIGSFICSANSACDFVTEAKK